MQNNVADDEEINVQRIISLLFENRWTVSAITLVFCIIATTYVLTVKPVFEADALVQVEPKNSSLSALSDITSILNDNDIQSTTEIGTIQSRRVLTQAVAEQNLTTEIVPAGFAIMNVIKGIKDDGVIVGEFSVPPQLEAGILDLEVGTGGSYSLSDDNGKIAEGHVRQRLVAMAGKFILTVDQIDAPAGSHFKLKHLPVELATAELNKKLKVEEQGKQSGIIQLSLRGKDKGKIVRILNSVANAYVQQNIQRRAEEAKKSLDFLRDQLPKVKADLYRSEEALNAFRLRRGSLDMELEAKSVLEQSAMYQLQLSDLAVKQSALGRYYSPQHPAYKALEDQRALVQRQQEALNRKVADLPDTQQQLLRLTRDVEVNEQLYLQMFDKIQELDVVRAGTVGNVRVLDDPVAQWLPVWPLKGLTIAMTTIFGLLVGVVVVLVRDIMNPGVESAEELENAGISVISVIPSSEQQSRLDKLKDGQSTVAAGTGVGHILGVARSEDTAIEAMRSLRTSLHFMMLEARNNIIMITGPSPNVGKTFVSSNFSIVMAHAGQRVLLIDADLRRGEVHQIFNLVPRRGLSELLSGKLSRDEVIVKSGVPNLDVVGRGAAPASPAELLMLPLMSEFLNWASANYDVVVIDTPPILAVTDAAILGHFAGSTLMTVRHRVNSVKEIDLAIKRCKQNGVNITGCILNGVDVGLKYGYRYGYYNYDYKSVQGD